MYVQKAINRDIETTNVFEYARTCTRVIRAQLIKADMYQHLNPYLSQKCRIVCYKDQGTSKPFKVGDNIVRMSNSLDRRLIQIQTVCVRTMAAIDKIRVTVLNFSKMKKNITATEPHRTIFNYFAISQNVTNAIGNHTLHMLHN